MKTEYLTRNPCYKSGRTIEVKGLMLHSVGCAQQNPRVFMESWNKESFDRACVHGFIGAEETIITLPCMETSGKAMRGWHGGGASNNTHLGFEMTEPACIKYVGGATFTCSDKSAAVAHVKKATRNAVELFAQLCTFHGLNPLTDIISHAEGHVMGIASNHGDPDHLWRQLGMNYGMDDFRREVAEEMKKEEKEVERYKTLDEIPEWARDTIEKLMQAHILNGDGQGASYEDYTIDLSHDMMRCLILTYRGGGFDKRLIAAGLEPAV